MSLPLVNAAQIALGMRHDGTSSLSGKIAEAAVLLDGIEADTVDVRPDGWGSMPNDWETVCDAIGGYLTEWDAVPTREQILQFIFAPDPFAAYFVPMAPPVTNPNHVGYIPLSQPPA